MDIRALLCDFLVVQMLHALLNVDLYGVKPDTPEYAHLVAELRKEALALLAPAARHDNIVKLLGVLLNDTRDLKALVFELADEGSLDNHVTRLVTRCGGRCGAASSCCRCLFEVSNPVNFLHYIVCGFLVLGELSISGAVDFETVRCWMEDSLKGLCHLHNGGPTATLHRDIKPANLLVFSTGNAARPYRVKLGDLGLAKALELGRSHGSVIGEGTPFTMAPEVLDGKYRTASDVFSWGITMSCAVMQAMGGVADPMVSYGADRVGLVAAAVTVLRRHKPAVASLLRRCCELDHTTRPSSSDALCTIQAAQHTAVVDSLTPPDAAQYDALAIVDAMVEVGINADVVLSVGDAIGGQDSSSLDVLLEQGVTPSRIASVRRVLDAAPPTFDISVGVLNVADLR